MVLLRVRLHRLTCVNRKTAEQRQDEIIAVNRDWISPYIYHINILRNLAERGGCPLEQKCYFKAKIDIFVNQH